MNTRGSLEYILAKARAAYNLQRKVTDIEVCILEELHKIDPCEIGAMRRRGISDCLYATDNREAIFGWLIRHTEAALKDVKQKEAGNAN